jgi:hypothetical protein
VTSETFGRVRVLNPGKHGDRDWRVEFNGAAPTHAELMFMLGFLFLAEDRYDQPGQKARFWLWSFAHRLAFHGRTPEHIRAIASEIAETMKKETAA